MAETTKTFTTEERIAFENKYNLGVYSHEALIELVMQLERSLIEATTHCLDLEKRLHIVEERLMEVGKLIREPDIHEGQENGIVKVTYGQSLADKWK